MKNKQQQIVYVNGNWCGTINCYLNEGWEVVSIHPVATKDQAGAYVLIEKENSIEEELNQVGVSIYNSDGTIKSTKEVIDEIAEAW